MTAASVVPNVQQGVGWEMEVLPGSILLRLDSSDETAMGRALGDLGSRCALADWVGTAVGFDASDREIWLFVNEQGFTFSS